MAAETLGRRTGGVFRVLGTVLVGAFLALLVYGVVARAPNSPVLVSFHVPA